MTTAALSTTAAGTDALRASDADRERALDLLRDHWLAGRLTLDEYEERCDEAAGGRFLADLERALRELPYPLPEHAPLALPAPAAPPGRDLEAGAVLALILGVMSMAGVVLSMGMLFLLTLPTSMWAWSLGRQARRGTRRRDPRHRGHRRGARHPRDGDRVPAAVGLRAVARGLTARGNTRNQRQLFAKSGPYQPRSVRRPANGPYRVAHGQGHGEAHPPALPDLVSHGGAPAGDRAGDPPRRRGLQRDERGRLRAPLLRRPLRARLARHRADRRAPGRRRRRAGELLAAPGELPPPGDRLLRRRARRACRPRCRCSTASSPTPSRCAWPCSRSRGGARTR